MSMSLSMSEKKKKKVGNPYYSLVLLLMTNISVVCQTQTRLRVVPHFSSGIVERAKRERA